MKFACIHGHTIQAWYASGVAVNLEGMLCPVCLGQVEDYGNIIDGRILAPVQEEIKEQ